MLLNLWRSNATLLFRHLHSADRLNPVPSTDVTVLETSDPHNDFFFLLWWLNRLHSSLQTPLLFSSYLCYLNPLALFTYLIWNSSITNLLSICCHSNVRLRLSHQLSQKKIKKKLLLNYCTSETYVLWCKVNETLFFSFFCLFLFRILHGLLKKI